MYTVKRLDDEGAEGLTLPSSEAVLLGSDDGRPPETIAIYRTEAEAQEAAAGAGYRAILEDIAARLADWVMDSEQLDTTASSVPNRSSERLLEERNKLMAILNSREAQARAMAVRVLETLLAGETNDSSMKKRAVALISALQAPYSVADDDDD